MVPQGVLHNLLASRILLRVIRADEFFSLIEFNPFDGAGHSRDFPLALFFLEDEYHLHYSIGASLDSGVRCNFPMLPVGIAHLYNLGLKVGVLFRR